MAEYDSFVGKSSNKSITETSSLSEMSDNDLHTYDDKDAEEMANERKYGEDTFQSKMEKLSSGFRNTVNKFINVTKWTGRSAENTDNEAESDEEDSANLELKLIESEVEGVYDPLSIFSKSKFKFFGCKYTTVIQAFAHIKAKKNKDFAAANALRFCIEPEEVVARSALIEETDAWKRKQVKWMEQILEAKAKEDDSFRLALLESFPDRLIHSTEDLLWGIGCTTEKFKSSRVSTYKGRNVYGKILEKLRQKLMTQAGISTEIKVEDIYYRLTDNYLVPTGEDADKTVVRNDDPKVRTFTPFPKSVKSVEESKENIIVDRLSSASLKEKNASRNDIGVEGNEINAKEMITDSTTTAANKPVTESLDSEKTKYTENESDTNNSTQNEVIDGATGSDQLDENANPSFTEVILQKTSDKITYSKRAGDECQDITKNKVNKPKPNQSEQGSLAMELGKADNQTFIRDTKWKTKFLNMLKWVPLNKNKVLPYEKVPGHSESSAENNDLQKDGKTGDKSESASVIMSCEKTDSVADNSRNGRNSKTNALNSGVNSEATFLSQENPSEQNFVSEYFQGQDMGDHNIEELEKQNDSMAVDIKLSLTRKKYVTLISVMVGILLMMLGLGFIIGWLHGSTKTDSSCQQQDCLVTSLEHENICLNGGQLTGNLTNSTYQCQCEQGWTGTICEIEIPENPCLNGGQMVIITNSTVDCQCEMGWTGTLCETDIDDCDSHPCENNGMCIDGVNTFTCSCLPGTLGNLCQIGNRNCCGDSDIHGIKFTRGYGSYLKYIQGNTWPSISISFQIELDFKTTSANAVIFYSGNGQGGPDAGDFFGAFLENGMLSFSCNNNIIPGKVTTSSTYNDGLWHSVTFRKTGGSFEIQIDDDTLLGSIGDDDGDYNSLITNTDLNVYFGGVSPDALSMMLEDLGVSSGLDGCIRQPTLNGDCFQNTWSEVYNTQLNGDCSTCLNDA